MHAASGCLLIYPLISSWRFDNCVGYDRKLILKELKFNILLNSCTEKLSHHLIVVVLQCSAKYSFTIAGS